MIELTSTQFAYGHRELLLNYAGIDLDYIIAGILQHGAGPAETIETFSPFFGFRPLPRYVFSKEIVRQQKSLGIKPGIPIGAPWIYLEELENKEKEGIDFKNDLVVFPTHSDSMRSSEISEEEILKKMQAWIDICGSNRLTICLYQNEFLNMKWHKVANEFGIRLWCNGLPNTFPIWSPNKSRLKFLYNLRTILSSTDNIITEDFSSTIFYAGFLRKNVGYFPLNFRAKDFPYGGNHKHLNLFSDEQELIARNFMAKFDFPVNGFMNQSRIGEISDLILGRPDKLSPSEMFNILKVVRVPGIQS